MWLKPQFAANLVATLERAFPDLAADTLASPGNSGGLPAVYLSVRDRFLGLFDRPRALTAGY